MLAVLACCLATYDLAFIPRPKAWKPALGFAAMKVTRVRDATLPVEGYELRVGPKCVTVAAHDESGFRHGMRRIHRMATLRNGHSVVPCGTMRDWPSVSWRGVHLFVGPNALHFHKELWEKVLLPLGFNKVVLECERTEWRCLPHLRGGIIMKRADLARLCDWYRAQGVEVIPLVESFGHMGWLFDDPAMSSLALNPSIPFALDPRKPGSAKLLKMLWPEVIQVTKAKTVHFGMDEIDMRGWVGPKAQLPDLWQREWSILRPILSRHHVRAMLWGDMCLAAGEGIDYCHAPDAATAREMRSAIPRGSLVGDWHYSGKQDQGKLRKSLDIWKREGFSPIASTWSNPSNIQGFTLTAIGARCGTLQTTWAGYESTERAIPHNLDQFGAFVLAAEYSWAGCSEPPTGFGYSANDVFLKLFRASATPRP